MQEELAPIRERRKYWEKNIPEVYDILKRGSEEAQKAAAETLKEVKTSMRINYFEDGALINDTMKNICKNNTVISLCEAYHGDFLSFKGIVQSRPLVYERLPSSLRTAGELSGILL